MWRDLIGPVAIIAVGVSLCLTLAVPVVMVGGSLLLLGMAGSAGTQYLVNRGWL